MLKGQDIIVLLQLLDDRDDPWTFRQMDRVLKLGTAALHRSITRLQEAGLVDAIRRPQPAQIDEFLFHASRFVFPPRTGPITRGVPTAWAAPPLSLKLAASDEPPPVWPTARGETRGIAFEPLHRHAVVISRRLPTLYEKLAVADALRMSDARVRTVARESLREWL